MHHEPGTTRDPIDTPFRLGEQDFVLVDTAGMRAAPLDRHLDRGGGGEDGARSAGPGRRGGPGHRHRTGRHRRGRQAGQRHRGVRPGHADRAQQERPHPRAELDARIQAAQDRARLRRVRPDRADLGPHRPGGAGHPQGGGQGISSNGLAGLPTVGSQQALRGDGDPAPAPRRAPGPPREALLRHPGRRLPAHLLRELQPAEAPWAPPTGATWSTSCGRSTASPAARSGSSSAPTSQPGRGRAGT